MHGEWQRFVLLKMPRNVLPRIPKAQWDHLLAVQDDAALYDLMTQPLHELLYRRQSFDLLDELPVMQQMLLGFDYVRAQVAQGGFLQFIQNKYISLLLPVIEGLKELDDTEMVSVLDDVLKVYVLNREALERETTVDEFAALYQEFREFEILDDRFNRLHEPAVRKIIRYAALHPDQFVLLTP